MSFPELLEGGDFEGTFGTYWTTYGAPTTVESSTAEVYDGTYSGHIVDASGFGGIYSAITFRTDKYRPYALDLYYYIVNGTLSVGLNYNSYPWTDYSTTGAWTHATITIPSSYTDNELTESFIIGNQDITHSAAPLECYFDLCSVKRSAFIPSALIVDQPAFGHGAFGHIGHGHGTVQFELKEATT